MTIRFTYWMRSEYWEPPKPRLRTSRGFISSASVSHRAILEEPVKTMLPNLGGWTLSCSSNLWMEGSQSWAWASTVERKGYFRSPTPAKHTESTTKLARALRMRWWIGWVMDFKFLLNL